MYLKNKDSNVCKLIKIVVIGIFLNACGNTGNQKIGELDKTELNNTSKKVKTKDDALSILGEPDDIDFNSAGQEKWTYKYTHSTSKVQNFIPIVNLFSRGTDDLNKKVVFFFDKQGILVHSAVTESKGETKLGIVH